MNHISIRFNKLRGQRGSIDHVWRVFVDSKEFLFKHLDIAGVIVRDERDGSDWNIACDGYLTIDRETSTAIIRGEP
jgi:hypothetical protein